MNGGLAGLQASLQHQFNDPKLLKRALTHRSFSSEHNERLEFLGDSVLNMSISHLLYERLRDVPEGDLSRIRANLVKQDTLHQIALRFNLSSLISLGEGELKSGGSKRASILADALEALIGAVLLDGGYVAADALVRRLYEDVEINPSMQAVAKDPKTELQEWLQGRKMKLPVYRVVGTIGAAHRQTFEVECEIPELSLAERGIAASRRAGEQTAAAAMLEVLKAGKQ